MTAIQIAEISESIDELLYDGTERYVVEVDGEYVGGMNDLLDAKGLADAASPRLRHVRHAARRGHRQRFLGPQDLDPAMTWPYKTTQRWFPELLVVRRGMRCEDGTAEWSIWSPDGRGRHLRQAGDVLNLLPTLRSGYGSCSARAFAYCPIFRGAPHQVNPGYERVQQDGPNAHWDFDRPVWWAER